MIWVAASYSFPNSPTSFTHVLWRWGRGSLIPITKFGHTKPPASSPPPQYLMTVPLHLELYNILFLNIQYSSGEYDTFQVHASFVIVDCNLNLICQQIEIYFQLRTLVINNEHYCMFQWMI